MKGSLVIIIFLVIALIASLTLTFRTTIFLGKATGSSSPIALENSYLFASPLQARSDAKETIRINIFILDGRGLGVAAQEVSLTADKSLNITAIQSATDDTGKAVFDITSPKAGQFQLTALVGNKALPQKVKVSFY